MKDHRRDMDEHQSTLSEPLIGADTDLAETYRKDSERSNRWKWPVIHSVLITLEILLLAVFMRSIRSGKPSSYSNASPADDVVQYNMKYFDKYGHLTSPFSKKPGPELDAAWHGQLSGMNIRVSEEWLQLSGADSIHLADGSGVLVQLGVYHELHCLKKIKHWIYRSYYNNNTSVLDIEEEEAHIEHCLEWLRIAALCRGDTTLTTFRWGGLKSDTLETEYPIPRRCVNSDALLRWSERHSVDITQPGLLQNSDG